jgi:hypothetical protein
MLKLDEIVAELEHHGLDVEIDKKNCITLSTSNFKLTITADSSYDRHTTEIEPYLQLKFERKVYGIIDLDEEFGTTVSTPVPPELTE